MKFTLVNNTVVLVASSHNPSLISNSFLRDTWFEKGFNEIDENNLLITPAVSQIVFKSGTSLQLDPERLVMTSLGDSDESVVLADTYCRTLPYIKGVALGINFVYTVSDFDFASWFLNVKSVRFRDSVSHGIEIKFTTDDGIKCNAKISMVGPTQGKVEFNFHRDLGIVLGELGVSIEERKKAYFPLANDFLAIVFK